MLAGAQAYSQTAAPKQLTLKTMEVNTPIREVANALPFISADDSAAQVLMANTILTDVFTGNLQAFEKGSDAKPLTLDEVKAKVERWDTTTVSGSKGTADKYITSFPLVSNVRFTEKWSYSGSKKTMAKTVTRIDFYKKFISKEGIHMGDTHLFYVKLNDN